MDEMGLQVGGLFVLLYEREPIGSEVQTLRNRLNRGNPVMRLKNAPPAAAADG